MWTWHIILRHPRVNSTCSRSNNRIPLLAPANKSPEKRQCSREGFSTDINGAANRQCRITILVLRTDVTLKSAEWARLLAALYETK